MFSKWICHNGKGPSNIFIHGFNTNISEVKNAIKKANLPGVSYLLIWNSKFNYKSNYISHNSTSVELIGKVAHKLFQQAISFKEKEKDSEKIGKSLLQLLNSKPHLKNFPLNLIGHSLGTRVIHYALYESNWKNYRINDVVLLDGAADADDGSWEYCSSKIQGRIFNCWSGNGIEFLVKPDMRNPIGKLGIPEKHGKIRNIHFPKIPHTNYWSCLNSVLKRGWFKEKECFFPVHEVGCPYCDCELEVDYKKSEIITCPDCKLEYRYDGMKSIAIKQKIACAYCGNNYYEISPLNPPKPGDYFECDSCEEESWIVKAA